MCVYIFYFIFFSLKPLNFEPKTSTFYRSPALSLGCNNISLFLLFLNIFMFLRVGLCFLSREVGHLYDARCSR